MKLTPFMLGCAALIGFAQSMTIRPVLVVGGSMKPSLQPYQLVKGDRAIDALRRGDVVVVDTPNGTVIKRIAFIEGDRIPQYYFADEWMTPTDSVLAYSYKHLNRPHRTLTVPKGFLFLLGDNVADSVDSRTYGFIPTSQVRMRVDGVPDLVVTIPGAKFSPNIATKPCA